MSEICAGGSDLTQEETESFHHLFCREYKESLAIDVANRASKYTRDNEKREREEREYIQW